MSANKVLGIFCFMLILLLTVTGTGFAQNGQPPKTSEVPVTPHFPTDKFPFDEDQLGNGRPVFARTASDLSAQALTLGAPGLSFRYMQSFGTVETPYLSDTTHLNRPEGLFMDTSNNLYVAEQQGARILKYNSSGVNTLAIGKAGMSYTDDYVFQNPADMAVDSGGNIWVVDYSRVVQYDSGGTILQSLPAQNDNPWQTGNTNVRFDNARGIAFGADGRMYVSDSNNHRIQVYTMSTGSPVYDTTIGTGSAGSGSTEFSSPYRIAMYGSNDLYVVDNGNNRIQHCTKSGTWSCTTLDSGLNNPQGIAVDSTNHVFVADTDNGRIRKCSSGMCADLGTQAYWPSDIGVDGSGNIYTSAAWNDIVVKYNSSGIQIGTFLGQQLVPYLTDNYHYNHPRVAIDSSNNIIIVEENGQRLTKLNASGVAQWSVGVPGVDNNDNTHLNWPHGVAVDTAGNIYVADNNRVQIYNGNGIYLNTIGGSGGAGNYEFNWATGIAVDNNGTIYVSDCPNNRVQVYNSSRTYVATLGVTGVSGSDNGHLSCPIGVSVDSARNIYVADAGNNRVQKYNSSRVWQMTLGTPGPWGSGSADFAYFGSGPEDIAVDAQGRIYVADIWNNRVQVFDSSGAYLTTIGGSWGANTSQFRSTSGVDLDNKGNVYVADFGNGRIQKFAPGVPGWQQKNINGFGDPTFSNALSMVVFNDQLYAGAANWSGVGASIWRTSDGSTWSSVMSSGFGSLGTNPAVISMIVFNGKLYAGTGWSGAPGQLWRSSDGTTWEQITGNGMGLNTGAFSVLAVYGNTLYAGTCGATGIDGVQIWRSTTGDSLSWTSVVTAGNTTTDNTCLSGLTVFDGSLYAAVENQITGAQIWRSATGDAGSWTQANTSGFGLASNDLVGSFAVFNGYLYIGTRNLTTGAQLWRSSNGTTWNLVMANGFGDANNEKLESLFVFNGSLYASLNNFITGLEVWQSNDGSTWSQINPDGFGDSNNQSTLFSNETVNFKGGLYLGVYNGANGVEIWRKLTAVETHIGGVLRGSYLLGAGESTRQNYAGVDSGPVKVVSTDGTPIVSAIREAWAVNGVTTSFFQMMGLPQEQLSDTYVFPGYNNVTLNEQLRISNVDTVPSTVTVTIGGVLRGTYPLAAGEAVRINYAGLDSGPVIVQGTTGVKIISAIREAWAVNGVTKSFVQLMGLPKQQLSDKYVFPGYNNVTLNEQLRIGNVDTVASTVTVTIGGVLRGTYILQPNEAVRVNYAGVDSGPVIVQGTSGVKIISAIREAWAVNGVTTSFAQLMGLPSGQLSNKYVFPGYNNVTLNDQLRIGNVDSVQTTVTVTIGGVLRGTYTLRPNEAVRVNYAGLDSGPVVVEGSAGVKIISAIREAWAVNGVTTSFTQLMGLPFEQLSSTFWFPAYNNVTLNEQLRIAVP